MRPKKVVNLNKAKEKLDIVLAEAGLFEKEELVQSVISKPIRRDKLVQAISDTPLKPRVLLDHRKIMSKTTDASRNLPEQADLSSLAAAVNGSQGSLPVDIIADNFVESPLSTAKSGSFESNIDTPTTAVSSSTVKGIDFFENEQTMNSIEISSSEKSNSPIAVFSNLETKTTKEAVIYPNLFTTPVSKPNSLKSLEQPTVKSLDPQPKMDTTITSKTSQQKSEILSPIKSSALINELKLKQSSKNVSLLSSKTKTLSENSTTSPVSKTHSRKPENLVSSPVYSNLSPSTAAPRKLLSKSLSDQQKTSLVQLKEQRVLTKAELAKSDTDLSSTIEDFIQLSNLARIISEQKINEPDKELEPQSVASSQSTRDSENRELAAQLPEPVVQFAEQNVRVSNENLFVAEHSRSESPVRETEETEETGKSFFDSANLEIESSPEKPQVEASYETGLLESRPLKPLRSLEPDGKENNSRETPGQLALKNIQDFMQNGEFAPLDSLSLDRINLEKASLKVQLAHLKNIYKTESSGDKIKMVRLEPYSACSQK